MSALQRSALLKEVAKVLQGPCGVPYEIFESSRLAEDLQLDSVGLLSLAVTLENHYKIRLADDPTSPPQTVSDVVDLVARSLGGTEEAR